MCFEGEGGAGGSTGIDVVLDSVGILESAKDS